MDEKDYILKASDLKNGESLFIPVATKKEQMKLFTRLCALAESYMQEVDSTISLAVCKTFQDKKLWIKIIKDKAPDSLFVKQVDGTVKKVSL